MALFFADLQCLQIVQNGFALDQAHSHGTEDNSVSEDGVIIQCQQTETAGERTQYDYQNYFNVIYLPPIHMLFRNDAHEYIMSKAVQHIARKGRVPRSDVPETRDADRIEYHIHHRAAGGGHRNKLCLLKVVLDISKQVK